MTEQMTAAEAARYRELMNAFDRLDMPPPVARKRLIRTAEKKKGSLDRLNDWLAEIGSGVQLHPTKGYRRRSAKSMLAAVITERMKSGERGWSTTQIKQVLKGELHL